MDPAPATRTSWKTTPLPAERARIPYERRFEPAEDRRVKLGLVPQQTEDKWFVYFEAGWLYFHRSWTGLCIYALRLRPDGEGSAVEEAWVNRSPAEYTRTDEGYDTRLLAFLVERLLLSGNAAFPMPESVAGDQKESAYLHHVVGRARANDEDSR